MIITTDTDAAWIQAAFSVAKLQNAGYNKNHMPFAAAEPLTAE
ncbi:MAG: hypothetical protein AB7C89_02225 [Intestinibacillus sp.]